MIYTKFKSLHQVQVAGRSGLTTLETRQLRGDQIEVFKTLNGYENIDRNIFSHSRKIIELEDMR